MSDRWLTVTDAAERANCGRRTIYQEARAGRLLAARMGGRRELRLRAEWVDSWLESCVPLRGQVVGPVTEVVV